MYMSDDEFLSNFRMDRACVMQLNSLIEDDEVFRRFSRNVGKQASILHVMVLLKFFRKLRECSGNAEDWTHDGHFERIG